jgi:hypothetical protein
VIVGWDPQLECPACGGDRELNGEACPECQEPDVDETLELAA